MVEDRETEVIIRGEVGDPVLINVNITTVDITVGEIGKGRNLRYF